MLTKEDTADEFGITDADVAEWDAIIEAYKANPESLRPWDEIKDEFREKLYRERAERKKRRNE
jgi:hypothetical protein